VVPTTVVRVVVELGADEEVAVSEDSVVLELGAGEEEAA